MINGDISISTLDDAVNIERVFILEYLWRIHYVEVLETFIDFKPVCSEQPQSQNNTYHFTAVLEVH